MSTSATYAVNLPLTNYIVGWYGTQLHDPARFLAPGVKAPGLLTSYKRYLRQDAFAVSDTRRGMYEAPRTIDIQGEDLPVMLEEHTLKIGIDDRELLGAIDQEVYRNSLRQAKTRGLARRMLISHNKEVFDYANSIIPSITKVGDTNEANKWTNLDLPLADILKKMAKQFARNNGVYPNRILTTGDIWDLVEANKQIQYKMGEGSPKVLTQDKFLDFSSKTSLRNPSFFGKNQITAMGDPNISKYVKVSGTSDMVDYLSILGVKQLATSAQQLSDSKGEAGSITTDITKDKFENGSANILSSHLEGMKLTFGTYNPQDQRFNEAVTFTFPSSYVEKDEDGNPKKGPDGKDKVQEIDYTQPPEELVKHLNEALRSQQFMSDKAGKSGIEFSYDEVSKKISINTTADISDAGKNYVIRDSSSASIAPIAIMSF